MPEERRQEKEREGPSNSMAEPVLTGVFPSEKMAVRTVSQDRDVFYILKSWCRMEIASNNLAGDKLCS